MYYVFIAAVAGLESVEPACFVQSGIGIGLDPFVYSEFVIAVALRVKKGLKKRGPGGQVRRSSFG